MVTAFIIESSKTLSQDAAETTNGLLLSLLRNQTDSGFPNPEDTVFRPESHNVVTNTLYYLSLSLALSVSLINIIVRQWLRVHHQKNSIGDSQQAACLRQARLDAFEYWKIPNILSALPLLIQLALIFFFVGLLNQLWHTSEDHTVFIVIVVLFGMTVCFIVGTTILPALFLQSEDYRRKFCGFRSPQSLLFVHVYHFCVLLKYWLRLKLPVILKLVFMVARYRNLGEVQTSRRYNISVPDYVRKRHAINSWVDFDSANSRIEPGYCDDDIFQGRDRKWSALRWTKEHLSMADNMPNALARCAVEKEYGMDSLGGLKGAFEVMERERIRTRCHVRYPDL